MTYNVLMGILNLLTHPFIYILFNQEGPCTESASTVSAVRFDTALEMDAHVSQAVIHMVALHAPYNGIGIRQDHRATPFIRCA